MSGYDDLVNALVYLLYFLFLFSMNGRKRALCEERKGQQLQTITHKADLIQTCFVDQLIGHKTFYVTLTTLLGLFGDLQRSNSAGVYLQARKIIMNDSQL